MEPEEKAEEEEEESNNSACSSINRKIEIMHQYSIERHMLTHHIAECQNTWK
jgi:hypothetical protein